MSDPLSPARGIIVGVLLGLALWFLAGTIAAIIVQCLSR